MPTRPDGFVEPHITYGFDIPGTTYQSLQDGVAKHSGWDLVPPGDAHVPPPTFPTFSGGLSLTLPHLFYPML